MGAVFGGLSSTDGDFWLTVWYAFQMFNSGERRCDICERTVTKGDPYFAVLVPKDFVPTQVNIAGSGLSVDAVGNVRVDMCQQCKTAMGLSGEEATD